MACIKLPFMVPGLNYHTQQEDGNIRGPSKRICFKEEPIINYSRKGDGIIYNSSKIVRLNQIGKHNGATTIDEAGSTTITSIPNICQYQEPNLPPLVATLKNSINNDYVGFHFPGHNRGHAAPTTLAQLIGMGPFIHDFTEVLSLDKFSAPDGPLLEAKKEAAKLFGALETWFLVGGTTCGIQAAIMATCSPGDTLILTRNSHVSAFTGMVLSGAVPKYIIPEHNVEWDIPGGITPLQVKRALEESKKEGKKTAAVFMTSPTYQGICSNIKEISKICHSYGVPLIVDEAHGAHFRFHKDMPSPALDQGVDIVIQSTHKVLCSLAQSSMLHISSEKLIDKERLHKCIHTLQTTSPSWLLLASLDAARHELGKDPENIFNGSVELATKAKFLISKIPGISTLNLSSFPNFVGMDPLRLTFCAWNLGLSGFQLRDILFEDYKIIPELWGTKSITLALSLGTRPEHIERLVSGLEHLSSTIFPLRGHEKNEMRNNFKTTSFNVGNLRLTPREAFFSRKRAVKIEDSIGKVCGEFICPLPPGIPILAPGEIITGSALRYLIHVKDQGGHITGAADPLLTSIIICNE